jgi:hypothetical protein
MLTTTASDWIVVGEQDIQRRGGADPSAVRKRQQLARELATRGSLSGFDRFSEVPGLPTRTFHRLPGPTERLPERDAGLELDGI